MHKHDTVQRASANSKPFSRSLFVQLVWQFVQLTCKRGMTSGRLVGAKKRAATGGHKTKNVSRVMNLPKMQQAYGL